jgi:hypothetical protein
LSISTTYYKVNVLNLIRDDLLSSASYVFYSKVTPWDDDDNPPDPDHDVESKFSAYREMIYGKRIDADDMAFLVDRYFWTSNTVYAHYDHDEELVDENYFVITDDRNVYKCLFNNYGVPSTSKPTITANTPFTSGDGYVWKFLYNVAQQTIDTFGDASLMPFEANSTIESAAVEGSIDVIIIDESGNNWTAVTDGSVQSKVSNTLIQLQANAATVNSVYDSSAFYVTSGNGAGFISTISSYISNSTGNWVTLSTPANDVSFGSQYYVSPRITIEGDGSGSVAFATVNTTTAVIQAITVINAGSGYSYANIAATAAASNADFEARAMIAPPGGHGSDPLNELRCSRLAIVTTTTNADSVPTTLTFRTSGLLIDPSNTSGNSFTSSEFTQYSYATITLGGGVLDPPAAGELITGGTSGASGVVFDSNTTHIKFTGVLGTFANGESIISNTSSTVAEISAINNGQLETNSGEIWNLDYFEPVTRSTTSSEKVRLIVRI